MVKYSIISLFLTLLTSMTHAEEPGVEVENPFYYVKENGKAKIVTDSYRDRRSKWAVRVELGSSFYDPVEDNVDRDGSSFFASFGFDRNFKSFSFGPEVSYLSTGFKTSTSSDISANVLMVGGNLYLDGLFKAAPFVVPFVGFGIASFDVDNDTISDSETKEDFSTYFKAGALIQLNWLDKITAAKGYYNYGLENTFVVLQVRNVSKTDEDISINLGSSMSFELGIQLEF